MCSPRSFFFFRRQPPCQILQRKKANESETVRVPKHCNALLFRALQCASIASNFSRSGMKDEETWTCLLPYKSSTKGAAHGVILLSRLRFLFSLSPLSAWLLVEGEDCRFWNAGPSPACYCWVSKEHPGGQRDIFWKSIVPRKSFTSLTHEHFQPTTPSTSPYSARTNWLQLAVQIDKSKIKMFTVILWMWVFTLVTTGNPLTWSSGLWSCLCIECNTLAAVRPFVYMTTAGQHPWNHKCLRTAAGVSSFDNTTPWPAV